MLKHWLRCSSVAGIVLAGLLPATARAQPLTDNQIYAAFCLGVSHQKYTNFQRAIAKDPTIKSFAQGALDGAARQMRRFDAYLTMTGAASISAAYLGQTQGENAVIECLAAVKACKGQECLDVQDSPSCASANRCDGPDQLPN